ncbi:MAG: transglutaminase family protein [Alphaproteobacteria bacterium]
MRYDIRQRTTYTYPDAVRGSEQVMRLRPLSRLNQRVVASSLVIVPQPVSWHDSTDFFGNATTVALIAEPHRELKITTQARVDVDRPAPAAPTQPWEPICSEAVTAHDLGPDSPVHFIFASPLVPLLESIGDYVRTSFMKGRPIAEAALDVAQRMKADFKYDPTATDVTTPVAQSFETRAGVCQDFAQIMISGLRGLGIPAGYVSGYLRTDPPPGRPRLEGADAMHAWVRVWCGAEAGWVEFDPTNGILVGNDHVVLAVGRDYSDVSPTVGTLKTYGRHAIAIAVDILPVSQ